MATKKSVHEARQTLQLGNHGQGSSCYGKAGKENFNLFLIIATTTSISQTTYHHSPLTGLSS